MTTFAFSTLGCSGLPLANAADIAARNGFHGIELRAADDEPVHVGLSAGERRAARDVLRANGVEPLAIASYVRIAAEDAMDEEVVISGIAHGQLAADIGAPYLRVFPGGGARSAECDARAADRLAAICAGSATTGVTIAVETHDSHPRGADLAPVVEQCPDAAVIWDALHPWRADEAPAETVAAIGDRLAYAQVKDVASAADLTPIPPGEGVLPLDDMAQTLRDNGFDGWVSWEYERKWFPDRAPLDELAPAVARWMRIVFGGGRR